MVLAVVGGGQHEWVWAAIAAGDVTAVRAAPVTFDISSIHPRHGSVLTAFFQALLNLEGRFIVEPNRSRRAKELVEELGRRGARPDLVIPGACIEVKGLYRDWRLTGDITAMQAVIQMRNDLMQYRFESGANAEDEDGAVGDAEILSELVDRYAELTARAVRFAPRSLVPEVVIDMWEKCMQDTERADMELVSPDGRTPAHCLLLAQASPVVAAMLACGMQEGASKEVPVQEPTRVVRLFLTLLYTGCVPAEQEQTTGSTPAPELAVGARVAVASAFVSNSARSMLLPAGLGGEVQVLDRAGDALLKFDGVPTRQWVARRNFCRLCAPGSKSISQLQQDLAGALALAHRWQVAGLAEVLAERLESGISAESFATTLEVAVLHGVGRLQAACLAFAQNSAQVRAAYEESSYSPTVQAALDPIYTGGPRKRAREAL